MAAFRRLRSVRLGGTDNLTTVRGHKHMKQTRLSMNRLARMFITTAIGSALAAGQYVAFADTPATPADDSRDSNQLGEVVVTANKRPEELLKVPAPVTALQAADLTRWGS